MPIQLDDSRSFFANDRWLSLAEVFELELSGIVFRFFHLQSNVQFHVERLVETVEVVNAGPSGIEKQSFINDVTYTNSILT